MTTGAVNGVMGPQAEERLRLRKLERGSAPEPSERDPADTSTSNF